MRVHDGRTEKHLRTHILTTMRQRREREEERVVGGEGDDRDRDDRDDGARDTWR